MSMSAPPLSPLFSDDLPNSPTSLTSPPPSRPTPLGQSFAHNKHPPNNSDPVPFPTAPIDKLEPVSVEFPFPVAPSAADHHPPAGLRPGGRVSSGGEVLAQLARSLSAKSDAPAQPNGPVLDVEWLQTKDREELEALLVAADAVIRDSQSQLQTVAEVGKALLDENAQLRTMHDSLLAKSHQPRHRSTLSQSSLNSSSPEAPVRRQPHLFSPVEPRIAIDRASTSPAGLFGHCGGPRGSDDRSLGSEPTSPTTSVRYNGIGLGPSSVARARVTSASSVSSLFAPSPRTHLALSSAEVHALSQANYSLSAQLTDLEAEAEQQAQEGRKRLRKLEKEINGLRSELQRTSERNQALEDTVFQVASQTNASADSSLEEAGPGASNAIEATPRTSRRPSRNETLSSLGIVSDFAPPYSPVKGGAHKTPTGRGRGLALNQLRKPSAPDPSEAVMARLMADIDELQKENEAIEEGRHEMEAKLSKAHDEVQSFKRRCEELEDEIGLGPHQPAIGWHQTSTPGGSPVQLKGNRREIERRRRISEHGASRVTDSRRSSGHMSLSASDKSLANSAQSDSPKVSPRFTAFAKRDRPAFCTGRTLESEMGDGSFEENDYKLHPQQDYSQQEDDRYDCEHSQEYSHDSSSTAAGFPADTAYHQTRVVSVYTGVRASHSFLPPGSLRRSGPGEEDQCSTTDRAVTGPELQWRDSVDPYNRLNEPTPRGLRHTLLNSLDWGRDPRGDSDSDEDPDPRQDVKCPSREEQQEATAMRERMSRLSYSSLRTRVRVTKKKPRRIGSGATAEEEEGSKPSWVGLSRREAARKRLGLETDDSEFADRSDYLAQDGDDGRSCVSVASEFDLLEGERPGQADYWPIAVRARYAPRTLVHRSMDAVLRQLVILLVYVRFYALLALAVGFALWQGPEKTGRRIR